MCSVLTAHCRPQVEWSAVRSEARLVQCFLKKYRPEGYPLTPFMARAMPPTPLLPTGVCDGRVARVVCLLLMGDGMMWVFVSFVGVMKINVRR